MNTTRKNIRQKITHTTATRIPAMLCSLIALLMLAMLTVSATGAEGILSSMTDPVTAQGSGSFFDPAPAPAPNPAATTTDITRGFSYSAVTGKQTDYVYEYKEDSIIDFCYAQVNEKDFEAYGIFLKQQGFAADSLGTDTESWNMYEVYNDSLYFDFFVAYDRNRQLLLLEFCTENDTGYSSNEYNNIDYIFGNNTSGNYGYDFSGSYDLDYGFGSYSDYGYYYNLNGVGY